MKTDAEEQARLQSLHMANSLMLLSRVGESQPSPLASGRFFQCKTCNRRFRSFQALGGHRASHKKHRIVAGDPGQLLRSPGKPKMHECSICGLEFANGQALGGHMRRHRAAVAGERLAAAVPSVPAVVKRSNSKRVLCLDLNLTPSENDLTFEIGRNTTAVR
ncbi:zinc finger protein ZAT11-like [Malania oleifera]|uniref:zinc finger protein ZAT11-like n=1 Tax=Malania oleifera TaxID=397392 RepID=UPI0025AE0691|nr:zinc finger protein ZAT11-like [Malania oleifera]